MNKSLRAPNKRQEWFKLLLAGFIEIIVIYFIILFVSNVNLRQPRWS